MNYRSIYKKHKGEIPEGWHIHHIDSDRTNNDITNLIAMSPFNHWIQHYIQGDKVAVKGGKFIQRATRPGEMNGMYGKKHSEETLDKHFRGKNHPMYGKTPHNKGKKGCKVAHKKGWETRKLLRGFRQLLDEVFRTELSINENGWKTRRNKE